MGRRGPPKTPTAVNEARGNPGRRTNPQEPKAPLLASRVPVPDWLAADDAASREWCRLAGQLQQVKILTDLDLNLLAQYCRLFSILIAVQREIAERGTTVVSETKHGSTVSSAPQFAQLLALTREMRMLGGELGLSPSSRAGLHVEVDAPDKQLAVFRGGKVS